MAILSVSAVAPAQASTVVAQQDMAAMETALNSAVFDTGYYVSLENLNDLSGTNTINDYDSIQDQGGVYTITPNIGTFSAQRRNLATAFLAWNGPYVTYQQGRTQTGTEPYDVGSPLDPWGNPYYFFNPLGLIRGDQGIITQELYGDFFDRYTIVSLGPDGEVGGGDDVTRPVGGGVDGTHLTSLKGPGVSMISAPLDAPVYEVAAGTAVTLRGINFGDPANNKHIIFGDTVITEVTEWTSREVTVVIPDTLAGTDEFAVQMGTSRTNGITATIVGSDTSVSNWGDY